MQISKPVLTWFLLMILTKIGLVQYVYEGLFSSLQEKRTAFMKQGSLLPVLVIFSLYKLRIIVPPEKTLLVEKKLCM